MCLPQLHWINYMQQLGSGAVLIPFLYLGEWMVHVSDLWMAKCV